MNGFATDIRQGVLRPFILLGVLAGVGLGLFGGYAFSAEITCSHVEPLCQGTGGNDQIYGFSNENNVIAREGADKVWTYAGLDEISGDTDADNLNGGEGTDYVFGGLGNDSYFYVGSGGWGVYGQSGQDGLYGGVAQDFIEGNLGNDSMYGNDHSDTLAAEDGFFDTVDGNGVSPGIPQICYVDGLDAWSNCTPQ